MTLPGAPRRAKRRRWPAVSAASLVVVAAAWSGLWLLASAQAGAGLDAWQRAEAQAGRTWTCPSRRIEGYPFAVHLRCARPTYHGEVAGRTADGMVEGLSAVVALDHPRTVVVDLQGPFNLRDENEEFDLVVSWATLRMSLEGVPDPPTRGGLAATRLAVTLMTRTAGELNLRAAGLSAQASAVPSAPGDAAFTFAASAMVFPTLDALPGLDQPADAEGQGTLVHADQLSSPTVARLEDWRQSGGALHLAAVTVDKGAFHGSASGVLGLDEAHRPTGHLDTSVAGFEPIARRFGIPMAGVQIGGLLSSLLGGRAAPAAPAGAVQMPLTFADGRLSVGPFKTPVRLDPLY